MYSYNVNGKWAHNDIKLKEKKLLQIIKSHTNFIK